ncbi:MAG: Hsp70 family protein [Methyloceanibacter sp.]
MNKPMAAALACGLDRLSQELRIVVIDFGGGTLDVTIMEFGKGVFEVRRRVATLSSVGPIWTSSSLSLPIISAQQKAVDVRDDRMAAARLREGR